MRWISFLVELFGHSCKRVLAVLVLLVLIAVGVGLVTIYSLAEYHLRQAGERWATSYERAAEHIHKALRYRPHSVSLLLLAARVARQEWKLNDAAAYLAAARRSRTGRPKSSNLRSCCSVSRGRRSTTRNS